MYGETTGRSRSMLSAVVCRMRLIARGSTCCVAALMSKLLGHSLARSEIGAPALRAAAMPPHIRMAWLETGKSLLGTPLAAWVIGLKNTGWAKVPIGFSRYFDAAWPLS